MLYKNEDLRNNKYNIKNSSEYLMDIYKKMFDCEENSNAK